MINSTEDRTAPLTPQLALRVAIVGGIALVMFAVIFFRLWVLQVLTGNQYVQQAKANDARPIAVAAPRGEILDRSGGVMVGSEPVPSVQISAPNLPNPVTATVTDLSFPTAKNTALYNNLAHVLGMSTKPRTCTYNLWIGPKAHTEKARLSPVACLVAQGVASAPYAKVTIKSGVSPDVQAYLAERQAQFNGVVSQEVYTRQYPLGDLAAQLFGTVGPITAQETKQKHFKGIPNTDTVGQSGLEYQYNQFLQGTDGYEKVKVNAQGQFQGYERGTAPVAGDNLQLSIDLPLQKVGEQSLAESIAKNPPADGGAFVAIDPTNGQVLAMGSSPTFNPSVFTHPMTQKQYDQQFGPNSGSPLLNRAIQAAGPDGSTFKVITSTAALESGVWGLNQTYADNGQFCFPKTVLSTTGSSLCLHNAGNAVYGTTDLVNAIRYSVDTFFYNLGFHLNVDPNTHPNGGPLQDWARQYGIGQPTGIDLPGEVGGTLPTPKYLAYLYKQEKMCENATGPYKGHPKHPASTGGCGIANVPYWTVGDNVNTAVGQGDVQVTPIQLAVVYSALANGGTIITPHVGMDVQSSSGTIIQKIDPGPKRHLNINPTYLQAIRQGLYEAANFPGGTSADVMGNFPLKVYGKTGTAQYINNGTEVDAAWYACYVPPTETSRPIVVVATVQKGGYGAIAAAPIARQLLSQWFLGKPGPFTSGTSKTL